ncbi:MAG: aspartate carbamoyltransferase catalytic subunit [Sphingobacteriia bacterium]|nr:aspartate carbamoyltransferase catalytic subunit [Sphingobacteriia bacterium]
MIKPRHLISIAQLTKEDIENITNLAKEFKKNKRSNNLKERNVATIFFEESTRTRTSFELAAHNLGAYVIHLDVGKSSVSKGETIIDTINTLNAMDIDYFVIRHNQSGILNLVTPYVKGHIINAGDGCNEHPSQALLDYFTMIDNINDIKGKTISIVGDILHSRVARSNIKLLNKFGAKVRLVGPRTLLPIHESAEFTCYDSLKDGIKDADIVMMLRIQLERMEKKFIPSLNDYKKLYQLNSNTIEYAHKDALIMHPGPINRGIEISDEMFDWPKKVVLKQVENGIYVRQAIFSYLEGNNR